MRQKHLEEDSKHSPRADSRDGKAGVCEHRGDHRRRPNLYTVLMVMAGDKRIAVAGSGLRLLHLCRHRVFLFVWIQTKKWRPVAHDPCPLPSAGVASLPVRRQTHARGGLESIRLMLLSASACSSLSLSFSVCVVDKSPPVPTQTTVPATTLFKFRAPRPSGHHTGRQTTYRYAVVKTSGPPVRQYAGWLPSGHATVAVVWAPHWPHVQQGADEP
jgi:hypothetical protein